MVSQKKALFTFLCLMLLIVHVSCITYVKFALKHATEYTNITGMSLKGVWLWMIIS